jgi:hypothetical protein
VKIESPFSTRELSGNPGFLNNSYVGLASGLFLFQLRTKDALLLVSARNKQSIEKALQHHQNSHCITVREFR